MFFRAVIRERDQGIIKYDENVTPVGVGTLLKWPGIQIGMINQGRRDRPVHCQIGISTGPKVSDQEEALHFQHEDNGRSGAAAPDVAPVVRREGVHHHFPVPMARFRASKCSRALRRWCSGSNCDTS